MSPAPDADRPEHWQIARDSRQDPMPEVLVVQARVPLRRYLIVAISALVIGLCLGAAVLQRRESSVITVVAAPSIVTVVVTATSPPPAPTATATPSPAPTRTPTSTTTPTPRPVPTSTSSAPPSSIAIVKARALNVRAGPGVDHAIVGYAAQGQHFPITGANAEHTWLRIDFNSLVGWVSARWVERPNEAVPGGLEPAGTRQEN